MTTAAPIPIALGSFTQKNFHAWNSSVTAAAKKEDILSRLSPDMATHTVRVGGATGLLRNPWSDPLEAPEPHALNAAAGAVNAFNTLQSAYKKERTAVAALEHAILESVGATDLTAINVLTNGLFNVSLAEAMVLINQTYGYLTPEIIQIHQLTMKSVQGKSTIKYIADANEAFQALGGSEGMHDTQRLQIIMQALANDGRAASFLEHYKTTPMATRSYAHFASALLGRVTQDGDFTPVASAFTGGGHALVASSTVSRIAIPADATLPELEDLRKRTTTAINTIKNVHWCGSHGPASSHAHANCHRHEAWHNDDKWALKKNWGDRNHPRKALA